MMPVFPQTPNETSIRRLYASLGRLLGCFPAHGKFLVLHLLYVNPNGAKCGSSGGLISYKLGEDLCTSPCFFSHCFM